MQALIIIERAAAPVAITAGDRHVADLVAGQRISIDHAAQLRSAAAFAALVINGDAQGGQLIADLYTDQAHAERYLLQPGGRDAWGASVVLDCWAGDWASLAPAMPASAASEPPAGVPELIPAPLRLT